MNLVQQTKTCYPIRDLKFDVNELADAARQLITSLMLEGWEERVDKRPFHTVNLTHIKGLEGKDRFWKYSGSHEDIAPFVNEADFTETTDIVRDSKIGEAMVQLQDYHTARFKKPFIGRCQLIWVNRMACYPIHRDIHTPHRYHIPLWTHPDALWLFREGGNYQLMHMPADGRSWYLDPLQVEHSVVNLSHVQRCHLLMTTSI